MRTKVDVLRAVAKECDKATVKFHTFASEHEGYAVLKEEVDELWDEIKGAQNKRRMRAEAIQVAAMALRFVLDCCTEDHDATQGRA